MKIHHYHSKTKEYLSTATAREDPVGNPPLVPAYSTTVKPPEIQAGHTRCFIDRAWVQVEDHRGEIHYDSRTPRTITALGPVPNHLTLKPEPFSRAEQMARLRGDRNHQLAATDWTMLPDAPLNTEEKEAARIYRQILRDLPANVPDLDNIRWPDLAINKDFRSLRKDL